jgi:enoyl-CoA hydratase/carnithine racemase
MTTCCRFDRKVSIHGSSVGPGPARGSLLGLARRVPLGEALRSAPLGLDERVSARRAMEIGLVTEVLPRAELWSRGEEIARIIAAKPPAAVQGTVRAIWESLDDGRTQALRTGLAYTRSGASSTSTWWPRSTSPGSPPLT